MTAEVTSLGETQITTRAGRQRHPGGHGRAALAQPLREVVDPQLHAQPGSSTYFSLGSPAGRELGGGWRDLRPPPHRLLPFSRSWIGPVLAGRSEAS